MPELIRVLYPSDIVTHRPPRLAAQVEDNWPDLPPPEGVVSHAGRTFVRDQERAAEGHEDDAYLRRLEQRDPSIYGWQSMAEYLVRRAQLIPDPAESLIYGHAAGATSPVALAADLLLDHPDAHDAQADLRRAIGDRALSAYLHEVARFRASVRRVVDAWRTRGVL
jgi:hypothetical protein